MASRQAQIDEQIVKQMELRAQIEVELFQEKAARRATKRIATAKLEEEIRRAQNALDRWEMEHNPEALRRSIREMKSLVYTTEHAESLPPLAALEANKAAAMAKLEVYTKFHQFNQDYRKERARSRSEGDTYRSICNVHDDMERLLWHLKQEIEETDRRIQIKASCSATSAEVKAKCQQLQQQLADLEASKPKIPTRPTKISDRYKTKYECNCNPDWGCCCNAREAQREYQREAEQRHQEKKRRELESRIKTRMAQRSYSSSGI